MKCTRCQLERELEPNGRCSSCNISLKEYYENNKEKCRKRSSDYIKRNRAKVNCYKRELNRKNPLNTLLQQARTRAKRNGIPFDITREDIEIPEYCPVLGLKLAVNDGACKANSMTLDRIVPELGYVKGNVAVISFKANTIKNNASIEDLEKVLTWLKRQ